VVENESFAQLCPVFLVGVELRNFRSDDIILVGQIASAKLGRGSEQLVPKRKERGKIKRIGVWRHCFSGTVISSQNSGT